MRSWMLEAALRGAAPRAFPTASLENMLWVLLVLAFIHALGALAVGINQPLLDMDYFRQTQTALTTYWLLKGGPWLAYQTPALGAPWSVPFEFPVYELITAAVAAIGVPLDAAGRLVAFGFFLGSLLPLRILFDELKLGQVSYLATAILFLTCPLYLYWSRTFLIETCALFFAVLWLALLVRYLNRRVWTAVAGALAAGCLAILAKSTTFPAFTVLGSAIAAVTAIFLVAAVGVGIGRIYDAGQRVVGLFVIAAIAAGQLLFFYHRFFPALISDYTNNQLLRIAQIARDATQPGQSLIVIGADAQGSAVPYYAERKGLGLDPEIPLPLMQRVFAEPQRYLGDVPLGGVVYCIDQLPAYGASIPAIQSFIAGRAVVGEFGGCQLLGTRRPPS